MVLRAARPAEPPLKTPRLPALLRRQSAQALAGARAAAVPVPHWATRLLRLAGPAQPVRPRRAIRLASRQSALAATSQAIRQRLQPLLELQRFRLTPLAQRPTPRPSTAQRPVQALRACAPRQAFPQAWAAVPAPCPRLWHSVGCSLPGESVGACRPELTNGRKDGPFSRPCWPPDRPSPWPLPHPTTTLAGPWQ